MNILNIKYKNIYDTIIFYMFIHLIGNMLIPLNRWVGSILCFYAILQIIINIKKKGSLRFPFHGSVEALFIIYLLLDIFCVIIQSYFRGSAPWGNEFLSLLSYHFVSDSFYMAFLLPFFILIDYRKFSLSMFLKLVPYISCLGILFFAINYKNILLSAYRIQSHTFLNGEEFAKYFSSVSFSLLLWPVLKNKKKIIPVIIFGILALLTTIIMARRGSSLSIGIIFIFTIYQIIKKISFLKRILLFILLLGIGISLYNYYKINSKGIFINITEKGMNDSRGEVNRYFEKDVFNSLDLWFGRGLNGEYYCPQRYVDPEGGYMYVTYRQSIETGFYHLILKGGIIFAIIHVLILLGAVIKGMFHSNNIVIKSFSLWILLSLIELYPFGWPTFSIKFLLIWIGVCLCYSRRYRKMNDQKICNILKIQ